MFWIQYKITNGSGSENANTNTNTMEMTNENVNPKQLILKGRLRLPPNIPRSPLYKERK